MKKRVSALMTYRDARAFAHMSLADKLAFVLTLNDKEADELKYMWEAWARDDQLAPAGDWNIWLILAGRGWGKTKTGAEDSKDYGLKNPKSRIAIIAPTYADARDTCIEGDSGLLSVLPSKYVQAWNRSLGELILTNGTRYKLFSADEPERLRGPQHHRAWCDEFCAWRYPQDALDQLLFGLRLGIHPQLMITTTPKPTKQLRELLQRSDVHVTRGNTFDNADNLAATALEQLKQRYLGTRIGRQELYAEVIADVDGALWKREPMIEALRVRKAPELKRIVVGVDPSVTATEESAETGIVIAGVGVDGHGYVLQDRSLRATPNEWAGEVISGYYLFQADRVVAEVNNGGDLVETILRNLDSAVSYKAVRASRGKQLRAEPISSFYERGLVHHVGTMADLEDQMCNWLPGETSPDRLDALVWAMTDLLVVDGEPTAQGELEALQKFMQLRGVA